MTPLTLPTDPCVLLLYCVLYTPFFIIIPITYILRTKTNQNYNQFPRFVITFLSDDQELKCGTCKKIFSSSVSVKRHTERYHQENRFKCTLCNEKFGDKLNLKNHILEIHENVKRPRNNNTCRVACTLCSKTFADNRNLKNHIDGIHNQVKGPLVQCPICLKSFSSRNSLNKHTKYVHQGIRPFKCDICDATFSEKGKYER